VAARGAAVAAGQPAPQGAAGRDAHVHGGVALHRAGHAPAGLLARRLVEKGVRFVHLFDWGWDFHGTNPGEEIKDGLTKKCLTMDVPVAALIRDLRQRGLLEDTLVVWGGEFGRTPFNEKGNGRDHNPWGFTMWMAGGGVKGGVSVGETDEIGGAAVSDRMHVKNLHATALHLMGLEPERLTYFYNGLDQKLVGVEGAEPIKQILA